MTGMDKIGLIVNTEKERADEALASVLSHAKRLGFSVFLDEKAEKQTDEISCPVSEFSRNGVQAVVVLGGDGTMLDAVRAVSGQSLPLVGFNIGSLGYLTSVGEEQFGDALSLLRERRFSISWRTTLSAKILRKNGKSSVLPDALNEVEASRGASGSGVELALAVDGMDVACFLCDGLIVATPTGSTAYSLSAGGPVLLPDAESLVVNLICPHTLTFRPLVTRQTTRIGVRVTSADKPLVVSADGRNDELMTVGDRIEIALSGRPVPIIALDGFHPCDVMRRKLGWGCRGKLISPVMGDSPEKN